MPTLHNIQIPRPEPVQRIGLETGEPAVEPMSAFNIALDKNIRESKCTSTQADILRSLIPIFAQCYHLTHVSSVQRTMG